MREIKFRGWDKVENRMVNINSLDFPFDRPSGKHMSIDALDGNEWRSIDEVHLMQYTGLKHFKDNQEIYEGDVVKGYWWENGNQHRHIGVVTYINGRFVVRGVKQYRGMDDEINSVYEVIGNVHDNPEMVNQS